MGPSGAGKGSIAEAVLRRVPGLWLSRSWTTRPPRAGESPDAYVFVDRDAFEEAAAAGRFLERAEVFGHLYGTPVPDVPTGHDLLLEIDVQGAAQVTTMRPDAVVVLVEPPSRGVQEQRLRARGDDEDVISARLARADDELGAARRMARHTVVNDDLDRAADEVAGIVESHRTR